MATKIGGVEVARGGTIKWGALASVFGASWIYAATMGSIGVINSIGGFVSSSITGLGEFVSSGILLVFLGGGDAITTSWQEFGIAIRDLGPFAYVATILVVFATLSLTYYGVRAVGRAIL